MADSVATRSQAPVHLMVEPAPASARASRISFPHPGRVVWANKEFRVVSRPYHHAYKQLFHESRFSKRHARQVHGNARQGAGQLRQQTPLKVGPQRSLSLLTDPVRWSNSTISCNVRRRARRHPQRSRLSAHAGGLGAERKRFDHLPGKKCPIQRLLPTSKRAATSKLTIFVVNHALFFVALALRARGWARRRLRPNTTRSSLDEAHTLKTSPPTPLPVDHTRPWGATTCSIALRRSPGQGVVC